LSNIVNKYFFSLLNLIFPSRCIGCKKREENLLCEDCIRKIDFLTPPYCKICGKKAKGIVLENSICGECRTVNNYFEYARAAGEYRDLLKKAIHFFKYRKKDRLKIPLGKILVEYLKNCDIKEYFYECDLIIPVPLHPKRLKERSFNQAQLLAEILGEELKIPVISDNLIRVKETSSQINLNKKEREENVRGAFSLKEKENIKGKNILLIDDVYTTGSTVRECAKILKKFGAKKINVLTLAKGGFSQ
jgi:ComF family protein